MRVQAALGSCLLWAGLAVGGIAEGKAKVLYDGPLQASVHSERGFTVWTTFPTNGLYDRLPREARLRIAAVDFSRFAVVAGTGFSAVDVGTHDGPASELIVSGERDQTSGVQLQWQRDADLSGWKSAHVVCVARVPRASWYSLRKRWIEGQEQTGLEGRLSWDPASGSASLRSPAGSLALAGRGLSRALASCRPDDGAQQIGAQCSRGSGARLTRSPPRIPRGRSAPSSRVQRAFPGSDTMPPGRIRP